MDEDFHAEADRILGPCLDPACRTGQPVPQTDARAPVYAPPVTLTRKTPRFGELAANIEERLDQLGVAIDPSDVDSEIRARVRAVAERLDVSDRTALKYVNDGVADDVARSIVVTARALLEGFGDQPTSRHLRLVR